MSYRKGGDQPRTILLVEDNPGDAHLISEFLAEQQAPGDRVVLVGSLADAGIRLAELDFDAVLLDLRLPDAVGVECVRAVRDWARDIPIVVLTGANDDGLAMACLEAGAQDYLAKSEVRAPNLHRAIGYAIARTRETAATVRAEAAQARLAGIVEASSDAIVSCSPEGAISSWNSGAERIFGFSCDETAAKRLGDVLRTSDATDCHVHLLRIASLPRGAEELTLRCKDGTQVIVSVTASTLRGPSHEVVGLAAICRDVTENKRRDETLRRNAEELLERDRLMRALTARLNAVREEERTRISREVHDEVGQLLTGLKMDLRWIERRLPADSDEIKDKLRESGALVDRTIATVQRIALELRPSALDALGLAAAIRDEARRFEGRTAIALDVSVPETCNPAPHVSTALFRIYQELLTNVARHAQASFVRIVLEDADGAYSLLVEDDGVGVARSDSELRNSLGLAGMRERAQALGGTFVLTRKSAGGTSATTRIPHGENHAHA